MEDDAEKLLCISYIRQTHLAIYSFQFQSVTICHGFISIGFSNLQA
jgi:hypothetical protein